MVLLACSGKTKVRIRHMIGLATPTNRSVLPHALSSRGNKVFVPALDESKEHSTIIIMKLATSTVDTAVPERRGFH